MRQVKVGLAAMVAATAVLVISSSVASAQPPEPSALSREIGDVKETETFWRGQRTEGLMARVALLKDAHSNVREPPGDG